MDEYVRDFIGRGGAAVKFNVPLDGAEPEEVYLPLSRQASHEGFVAAHIDGRTVKLHMMDRIFHELARQVDWDGLARSVAETVVRAVGLRTDGDDTLDLQRLAELNDLAHNLLRVEFIRHLQEQVYHDYEMPQEFRLAMHWLTLAQVDLTAGAQARRGRGRDLRPGPGTSVPRSLILLKRWGLLAWPIPTLEELGQAEGLSGERVRQVVARHESQLHGSGLCLPHASALAKAVMEAANACACPRVSTPSASRSAIRSGAPNAAGARACRTHRDTETGEPARHP